MRVAYVYPNPRDELVAEVAAGTAPDTALLGQNHLAEHGIDAWIHEPRLRPWHSGRPDLRHRLIWNAREALLPLELRGADVVVTPLANLLPLALRVARGPRVVLLDWAFGTTLRRASRLRRRVLAATARSAAVVACPSAAQRDFLLESLDLDPGRVRIVELGADASFFVAAPDAPADYVLAVGKDMARDYATLCEAARRGGFRTIVVALPRNLVGLAPPPNVEFRNGLSWLELRDLLAGAAVAVLPLRDPRATVGTDASGVTAVLEAMASGKAIVATRRPALETYLEDGRTGSFVPAEDPAVLAETIERLLGDDAARQALGRAARTEVEEQLNTRALGARVAAAVAATVPR